MSVERCLVLWFLIVGACSSENAVAPTTADAFVDAEVKDTDIHPDGGWLDLGSTDAGTRLVSCLICSKRCTGIAGTSSPNPFYFPYTNQFDDLISYDGMLSKISPSTVQSVVTMRPSPPAWPGPGINDEFTNQVMYIADEDRLTLQFGIAIADELESVLTMTTLVNGESIMFDSQILDQDRFIKHSFSAESVHVPFSGQVQLLSIAIPAHSFRSGFNDLFIGVRVFDGRSPILMYQRKYSLWVGSFDLPFMPCVEDQGVTKRRPEEEDRMGVAAYQVSFEGIAETDDAVTKVIEIPAGTTLNTDFFALPAVQNNRFDEMPAAAVALVNGKKVAGPFYYLTRYTDPIQFGRRIVYRNSFSFTLDEPGDYEFTMMGWYRPNQPEFSPDGERYEEMENGASGSSSSNLTSGIVRFRVTEPE